MDDVRNTIEALATNGARRTLSTLSLPSRTENGNGITNGDGVRNGHIPNGNDTQNGHEIPNGHDPSKLVNGTNHASVYVTRKSIPNGTTQEQSMQETANHVHSYQTPSKYELLVWSARDESTLTTMLQDQEQYFTANIHGPGHRLNQLAYTLAARRSVMNWRSFAVVGADEVAEGPAKIRPSKGVRVSREKGIAFVFTGQGAQYKRMGLELLQYPVFKSSLARADDVFFALGSKWSVTGKSCSLNLSSA